LDARVTQILVRHGHVDGVVATLASTGESITLHARTVIMAAGAIQTPALLMKSGLKNKHIGQHLKVHPTVYVNATMFASTPTTTTILNNSDKEDEGTTTITHHMKTADAFGCRIEAPIVDPGKSSRGEAVPID
jgi:choline dehydrogenase-like flavoprotein